MKYTLNARIGLGQVRRVLPLMVFGCLLSACSQTPEHSAAEMPKDVSDQATVLLRSACDTLAASKAYSCSAEIWEDVVLPGTDHKMQSSRAVELKVRRPDRLQAQVTAAGTKRFYYDGKSLVIFTPAENLYGKVDVPASIDDALDFVTEKYGVTIPLEDILVSDPYASAVKDVSVGRYLGKGVTMGVSCHHLGFSQKTIDWQIWIEDGPKPLIRKLVITYKTEPGSPQFTAMLTAWKLDAVFSDADFAFVPPAGAARIDMLPQPLAVKK